MKKFGVLISVLILITLLVACVNLPTEAVPPAEQPAGGISAKEPTGPLYIPNRVLVTGQRAALEPEEGIDFFQAQAKQLGIELELVERPIGFELPSEQVPAKLGGAGESSGLTPVRVASNIPRSGALAAPASLIQQSIELQTRIYQVVACAESERDEDPATCVIRRLGKDPQVEETPAVVEHDLITGHPWQTGGSPWQTGGSPHGGLIKDGGLNADHLRCQWAFGPPGPGPAGTHGINLVQPGTPPCTRLVERGGEGVVVGIFDTSPFSDPADAASLGWNMQVFSPTLAITVEMLSPAGLNDPGVDVSDHGLFVASLAHEVAPAAEIALVRVLNDDAEGAVSDLITAVDGFRTFDYPKATHPQRVINLALGVFAADVPPDDTDVVSLRLHLLAAANDDIVIVAASGNESDGNVVGPNVPARWHFVIGVAATNNVGDRSCFSNKAKPNDVASAGGGAAPGSACNPDPNVQPACTSAVCITGRIWPRSEGDPEYGLWRGTSFAAPMVAGLSALVLQGGVPGSGIGIVQQVRNALHAGISSPAPPPSDIGHGRVDVANTAP
ncbi:MAG: S8/S53 family peptidase [Anaerolineae bacterium]